METSADNERNEGERCIASREGTASLPAAFDQQNRFHQVTSWYVSYTLLPKTALDVPEGEIVVLTRSW